MKDKIATILRVILGLLLGVSLILFIVFYTKGEEFTNVVLIWAYILFALTALVTIIFPVIISNR
jgi:polyferredoxin